ncbi:MAG: DUF512 domain-containing protein [Firmicutes bacterium]|nr:DUF512 domain-containing protein [Bacillota bacterium]
MKISDVSKSGVCSELDICINDELIKINGKDFDCLDYIYHNAEEFVILTIKKQSGEIVEFEIEKEQEEDLGLTFFDFEIKQKSCSNKCIFCFVDQLPKGMRKSLYFKDDDYRLSFISGCYVTLTNLTKSDIEKIITQNLSPLYLSVHSLNRIIRQKMLNCKKDTDIESLLKLFSDNNIQMHCQIVVCKNINDGRHLIETVQGLHSFYPNVKTVAIVPVGLTKYREGLVKLDEIDAESAMSVIFDIEQLQELFIKKTGEPFVFLADEFYVKAEQPIKDYNFYGEFYQIENGVGLFAKFEQEFYERINELKNCNLNKSYCVVTSVSAARFIKALSKELELKFNCTIDVLPIINNFFGQSVTVAGLICGCDIMEQFNDKLYDKVLLPKCITKEFEDVLLDDISIKRLEQELKNKIEVVPVDGGAFIDAFINN